MASCVIFGGAGYVGTHLTRWFLRRGRFSHVHIADLRPTALEGLPGVTSSITDVRRGVPVGLIPRKPEWIFNLAAIHREPGHQADEYFETNLAGARNVCEYADAVGCDNIYFTSSISVYGDTTSPTDESAPIRPTTPYGASKYPAELIHEAWQRSASGRRLLISRPGVLYGPADPGNMLRMIRAVRNGYFAFPGSSLIYKSYGYIHGFIDSIDFAMASQAERLIYNYAESPTRNLRELVGTIKEVFHCRAVVLPIPLWLLLPVSRAVQCLFGSRNPVHPVRVRKAATPTHIIPQALHDMGYQFRYDFAHSLEHWLSIAPEDFDLEVSRPEPRRRLVFSVRNPVERESTQSGRIAQEAYEPKSERTTAAING